MIHPHQLTVHAHPKLTKSRMVIGLSGWMDGGEVSTGTLEYLADLFDARELASIAPDDFYIYNVPGSMETSALFRPHTRIEEGFVTSFDEPHNRFLVSEANNLILFDGKEPNLRWREYADCIVSMAREFDVQTICFVGSVSGLMPHTRPAEFYSSSSGEALRNLAMNHGCHPSNYEGPASFVTCLVKRASEANIDMMTLVAAIPAYVEGRNFSCIQAAVRRLSLLIDMPIDITELSQISREFERELDSFVKSRPELTAQIRKLEQAYDEQTGDSDRGDMQDWFNKQGIQSD